MSNKQASRILNKLAAANDARVTKLVARLEKIAAAEAQKTQRANAEKRRARDAAVFVLGGALLEQYTANEPSAIALVAKIASSLKREQDAAKIAEAVALGVIPAAFAKRATLSLKNEPAATAAA